eukprot:gene16179-29351_t
MYAASLVGLLLCCAAAAAATSQKEVGVKGDTDLTTYKRRVAAYVGGLVADAAAMPLHWIYDVNSIASILEQAGRTDTPGAGTPFAEQTSIYAHAIADQLKGGSGDWSLDVQHIADKYTAYYTKPANISRGYASYYDNATKGFLDSPKKLGDTETNAVAHVLPVVILRAGKPGFLKDAEAAIRIIQDTDEAVAFGMTFARILERVILGDGIQQAIVNVTETLKAGTGNRNDAFFAHGLSKMKEWSPRPPFDVTLEIGQDEATLKTQAGFASAVRETIKLGGENANRGTFIAAIVAAAVGDVSAVVPAAWMSKVIAIDDILDLAHLLASGGHRGRRQTESDSANTRTRTGTGTGTGTPGVGTHTRTATRKVTKKSNAASSSTHYRWHHDDQEILRNSPGCVANSNHTTSNATRPPSHPDDIAGLRALYLSTNGPEWDRNACWLNTSVPASNTLQGYLPSGMSSLTGLQDFQVGFNPGLTGPIPTDFGKLVSLERIYAWNASLTGVPAELGDLPALIAIDLTDNQLEGALPPSLSKLTTVNTAYFDGNSKLECPVGEKVEAWLHSVAYHAEPCA